MEKTMLGLKCLTDYLIFMLLFVSTAVNSHETDGKHMALPEHETSHGDGGDLLPSIVKKKTVAGAVGSSATVNVISFGAKGDGKKDDTKAFQAAWTECCKTAGSTMLIPSGLVFSVGPVTFLGTNCASNLNVQLDGTIVGPKSSSAWGSSSLLQWLDFSKVQGLQLSGKGIIEGNGPSWWTDIPVDNPFNGRKLGAKGTRPTALRFYGSTGVTVSGITIRNSPMMHLKFDSCKTVKVSGINVVSPGNSPNTDGIHLQNTQHVTISNCVIATGDDCVSIQTGCSAVDINSVTCGPGHGISIGGLGKDKSKACVSNINVHDSVFKNTLTGVRIKTWQGGLGSVYDVTYSNIKVTAVGTPMMIDQYYCDSSGPCPNSTSAVAISRISYNNIDGTYTKEPMRIACSDSSPCREISFSSIDLTSTGQKSVQQPFCWDAYGTVKTKTTPSISCLKAGDKFSNTLQSNIDPC